VGESHNSSSPPERGRVRPLHSQETEAAERNKRHGLGQKLSFPPTALPRVIKMTYCCLRMPVYYSIAVNPSHQERPENHEQGTFDICGGQTTWLVRVAGKDSFLAGAYIANNCGRPFQLISIDPHCYSFAIDRDDQYRKEFGQPSGLATSANDRLAV